MNHRTATVHPAATAAASTVAVGVAVGTESTAWMHTFSGERHGFLLGFHVVVMAPSRWWMDFLVSAACCCSAAVGVGSVMVEATAEATGLGAAGGTTATTGTATVDATVLVATGLGGCAGGWTAVIELATVGLSGGGGVDDCLSVEEVHGVIYLYATNSLIVYFYHVL